MVEESNRNINRKIASLLISVIILLAPCSVTVFAADVFTYDENGNMVSDGVYCYEYNEANQLSRVRDCASDELIAEYWYDHVGKRAVKKQYENGVLQHTTYYIGGLFETKLYPDGSTENTSYYFVNGERVARKDPDGSMHYYHGDHLGSTSVVTDSTGNLEEKTKYYPYGLVRAGGTESKYLFTGQEKDSETGLYYYGARYYNPEIMRFAQPDPIVQDVYDPQFLNRYSYVRNNPVKYVDPTGNYALTTWVDIASIAISVNDLQNDPGNAWNWVALGADVVTTALPVVAGGGIAVRALTKGDKAADIIKGAKGVDAVVEGADTVSDAAKAVEGAKAGGRAYGMRSSEILRKFNNPAARLDSGRTVLGSRTDDYVKVSKEYGANFLDLPKDVYSWDVNKRFIDEAMTRGDEIIFINRDLAKGTFKKEIDYVLEKRYTNIREVERYRPG